MKSNFYDSMLIFTNEIRDSFSALYMLCIHSLVVSLLVLYTYAQIQYMTVAWVFFSSWFTYTGSIKLEFLEVFEWAQNKMSLSARNHMIKSLKFQIQILHWQKENRWIWWIWMNKYLYFAGYSPYPLRMANSFVMLRPSGSSACNRRTKISKSQTLVAKFLQTIWRYQDGCQLSANLCKEYWT